MTEKAVNYTDAMEDRIREASPIDYEKAKVLGLEFGRKARSVVAKANSMKDVVYVAKEKGTSTKVVVTKADILKKIETVLELEVPSLEKATKADLEKVRDRLVEFLGEEDKDDE